MSQPSIDSIERLKAATAVALQGIGESCRACSFPDCQGYPWIMPEEEEGLLDAGLRLVQLNGEEGPTYLDTFRRDDATGAIVIGALSPPCPYRGADGRCTVHAARPLVCHLYPLTLEVVDGVVVWAVHTDCEFVQRKIAAERFAGFLADLRRMTERVAPDLRRRLVQTTERVHRESRPSAPVDCFTVLGPVEAAAERPDARAG
jgi:Fe-S-cluster containining protein